MGQTVIGFFKEPSDAQQAVGRLESKGIPQQNIQVSRSEYRDGTADLDGRNTNKFTDIFNKLFGHDSDDAKRYSTIGQSNVTMVMVHAASNDQAEEAADVLDDCGAVDVDEDGSIGNVSAGSEEVGNFSTDRGAIGRGEDNLEERSTMGSGDLRRRSRIINHSLDEDFHTRSL